MRNISAGIGGQVGHLMVNGPAGDALCWDAIDWRFHEDNVRRLRQRIFTAARDGDLGTLRNLQKLMLRSWSNTLLSVRQATQRNAGRKTAGVDGEVALTPQARAELAVQVHRGARSWRPLPVKRVHIPKAGNRAKLRPLGIPVIADRAIRAGSAPRWSLSGRPGSNPAPTGSVRAVAATTRSAQSSTPAKARGPSGCGRWTPTWPRRSTRSITTGCWTPSGRSRPGT